MAIEWHDRYSLGDSDMDAQHRMLFVLVNALLAATDKSSLTTAAANLFNHAREHFDYEESIMWRIGYPAVKTHVEQHNTLMAKLVNVSDMVANYTLDIKNLESFLSAWLFNHIETMDAQLVAYLRLVPVI